MKSTAHHYITAAVLERVRAGDAPARNQLVARIEPLLRRFAHGRMPQLLRHKEDTADLVQMTWLKVLGKLDSIDAREPGAFFAYLRAVLINALRESLRREAAGPIAGVSALIDVVEASMPAHVDPSDWQRTSRRWRDCHPSTAGWCCDVAL